MASFPQLPKPISPFFKTPPFSTKPLVFLNFQILRVSVNLKKKNTCLDPFDDNEDPNNEYRSLFVDVKQEEDSRPPDSPDNLEIADELHRRARFFAAKIRGYVRPCCCVISGCVHENLLFFPTNQLIKDRYNQMETV